MAAGSAARPKGMRPMADSPSLVNDVPAPRPEPEQEQAPLAWWQLRTWRVDRDILVRVLNGLHSLAPSEGAAAPLTETGEPGTGYPETGEPEAGEPEAKETGAEEPAAGAEPAPGTPAAPEPAAPEPVASSPPPAVETAAEEPPAEEPPVDPAVAAIRSTFAIVAGAGDAVPGYFSGQLFARQPRLRALFPPAMDAQRDRLVKALVQIVESLTTPEEMAAYLAQLGRDHRKYGVGPDMYEAVGAALLATLRRFAGPAFTPAAERAWTDAYAAVSALMIQAADEAAATAPGLWAAGGGGVGGRD